MEKLPSVQLCVLFATLPKNDEKPYEHDEELAIEVVKKHIVVDPFEFSLAQSQVVLSVARLLSGKNVGGHDFGRSFLTSDRFLRARDEYIATLKARSRVAEKQDRWRIAAELLASCPDHLRGA